MEKLVKFDYFHVIIDEVTLIGSQGSLLFLGDGIGTLAGVQEEKGDCREEKCAQKRLPAEARRSRLAGGGRGFSRSLFPCHGFHPALTVQGMGEVVN